ncbi:MAG: sulfite exporter TauE/SafE family protein [Ignavibacteriales bacterium]|nr:sulfite exporter TauE/SafE family protein [Ignavibacteriales bacterium]
MDLLAALTLGLLGSMHCIGMCGPLVLAVPSSSEKRWKFLLEKSLYNFGRAVTYGVMGALLGLIGKRILIGIEQDLSIVLGITILLTVAVPIGLKSKLEKFSPLKYVYLFVKRKFAVLMQKSGMTTLFVLGMLNGLLPCGLVYTALIGASVVADIWQSVLFMIVFGVGTIPALVAVSLSGKLLSLKFRSLFTRAIPIFSIALALILILRGMNLGIPLLSPKVTHTVTQSGSEAEVDCCE